MKFERITADGLAHHSYYLADGGDALVVDPRRDVDVYLDRARAHGHTIRYVLETHRNEDYAIGSTALQAATAADILHSDRLDFGYGIPVQHGDSFSLGRLRVRVLATPGHTDDSLTFAISDTDAGHAPVFAMTGDALFVGATGRIDLLGPDEAGRLATELHQSLFETILPLGDGAILCPGHGGGSVCGGNISDRDLSSIGVERAQNPHLQLRDVDRFVERKLQEQHVRPPYFDRMEEWNRKGNAPVHERLPLLEQLSPGQLEERIADGVKLIDARLPQAFAGAHVPGSFNVWYSGLTAYLTWVVAVGEPFAIILPEHADSADLVRRLRVQFPPSRVEIASNCGE